MEDKKYVLEGATLSYEVGFETGGVYCSLMNKKVKETDLNQVTKVILKKTSLGGGESYSFRIVFLKDGKEKKFPWIEMKVSDPVAKEFVEDLKSRIPQTADWEDRREKSRSVSEDGKEAYDMQFVPFKKIYGYRGVGLSRGLQLGIFTAVFGLFILPLIYFIPIWVKGGYRIYTDEEGLEIRRFGSKLFSWEEIQKVILTDLTVKVRNYDTYSTTTSRVFLLKFETTRGSDEAAMLLTEAAPLLRKLHEKGKVTDEQVKDLV